MKLLIVFLLFLLLVPQSAEAKTVLVAEINGVITVGTLELFEASLEEAKNLDAEALILILDTPGGGLEETLKIIKLIDRSEIPIISYVHPQGATAWSAGTMILVSSHVAAMSPNTVIGSAQPASVSPQGAVPINESKIINALTTLIAEKAKVHGRNETAAVEFITENLNLNSEQAKEINVIEFVSPSIEDLLNQTNGLAINATTQKTLDTQNAEIVEYQPSLKIQFLSFVTNPLLASLFLIIGIYALVFGLSSPGFGSEIAGIILIGLGFLGLGFSINLIAILLLAFGAVLVIIELYTAGFGVLGAAGIIALIIGSIILIPTSFPRYFISEEFQRTMAIAVILPSIVFGGFLAFALIKVVKMKRKTPVIGEIIGEEAKVTDKITSKHVGYVMYKGEIWRAESNQNLKVGERVIITDKKGHILTVKKPN